MFRRTLLNSCALVTKSKKYPDPPSGFAAHYALGSRQLLLSKDESSYSVFICCLIPSTRKVEKKRAGRKVVPKILSNSEPQPTFRCFVTAKDPTLPFSLDISCRSLCGQLVMDAVSFPKGSIDTTPGPEQAINQNYKGPNINQSDLADNIIGKDLRSSPISSSRQLLNEYFDEYSNYRISAKLKYGHWPVHTISPDLGEKIENVVNALGIDDNVAEYFDRVLPLLEEEEYNTWKSITSGYFGLNPQTNH